MPMPKLKNLFVSETCLRFCAIDLQISFLALAIACKKSKTVSETCAKWSQFGAVSETRGLASYYKKQGVAHSEKQRTVLHRGKYHCLACLQFD